MKEYKFKINGNDYRVAVDSIENGMAKVLVNGTPYEVEIEGQLSTPQAVKPVQVSPATYQATPQAAPTKVNPSPAVPTGQTPLKSPLPGVILDVKVREGDTVKEGQCLMILEAMKMENNIDAPKSGVVKQIVKRQGDSVLEGDTLLIIE
jgi:biotin carboxyl carrier protein